MRLRTRIFLGSAGLAVGVSAGFLAGSAHGRTTRTGDRRIANLGQAEVKVLVDMCRGIRGSVRWNVVDRANAHGADAMVTARKTRLDISPVVLASLAIPAKRFALFSVQVDLLPAAIVLMFADGQGRLIHYSYRVPSEWLDFTPCEFVPTQVWVETDIEAFSKLGTARADGLVYVDNTAFGNEKDTIRIPPGEVAVGLRYPDGSYSNFVRLMREWEASESPSELPATQRMESTKFWGDKF